jgi:cytochrome d ubiquinol oxidase subunit I
MLPTPDVVILSRTQFGLTALYHFLFVPLTLGLAVLLGIMESIYVMTRREIWRDMTKFWGILFGINFAMGVATGITLEFQFGTNWAYYSHYVGDVFGAPLAIEGLMAFFLEATFVGLFFFGWDRLSRHAHLIVTWLMALGTNLSALWILIANGWMQHPTGAYFDYHTLRMQVANFTQVLFNPVAQAKFVHTVSAGYVTGSVFVMAVSAYYLLRGRNPALAKRSITVASAFGLASALSVIVLGDESGYLTGANQKMKLAAMEAMWHTETPPAGFTLVGIPDQTHQVTHFAIRIPYVLGIIATRSLDEQILGINELVENNKIRIQEGLSAYAALQKLQANPTRVPDTQTLTLFNHAADDLGYALLLKRYTPDILHASMNQINQAAWDTVPRVLPIFIAFRLMVGCALIMLLLFMIAFYLSIREDFNKRWFLWIALLSLPLPWIASELGWFVAEYGRQPWVIDGVLPTFLAASSLTVRDLSISLTGFIAFYTLLAIIEVFLMIKYIRLGPDGIANRNS